MRTDDAFYSTYLDLRGIGKLNINTGRCNRYDTGFDETSQAVVAAMNGDRPSLNGHGHTSLQWIRYADHCLKIQTDMFMRCRPRSPRSRLLVLSMCVGEAYAFKTRCGTSSKEAYCHRYGHGYREIRASMAPDLPLIWTKIAAIREALKEDWDHVFYVDADVVITNPSFDISLLTGRFART